MKKVILSHACKINISAATDIPRITVIKQNEKAWLIASLVQLWSACQAKVSSYARDLLWQHVGAPLKQSRPKFNKHVLTVWLDISISISNPYQSARHWFRLWRIQRDRQPNFYFHECCHPSVWEIGIQVFDKRTESQK